MSEKQKEELKEFMEQVVENITQAYAEVNKGNEQYPSIF